MSGKKITAKYKDLHRMTEDQRIDQIGKYTMLSDKETAFITDDEPGKIERYLLKLFMNYPELELVGKKYGPTPGAVTAVVKRRTL